MLGHKNKDKYIVLFHGMRVEEFPTVITCYQHFVGYMTLILNDFSDMFVILQMALSQTWLSICTNLYNTNTVIKLVLLPFK